MNLSRNLLPLAALAMMTGFGFAQTPVQMSPDTKPAVTSPAPAAPAKKATKTSSERTAKSKACSAQADQKGLHGKARKRFRDDCKRS
ncbi:PsiF family protein [Bosea sp. TAF32]|uniref:PsiF family protein n=1 Tax=Bosea sp. TAF32 TaxID=3237482 RepID=UPI003F8DE24C